ncbi:LAME_0F14092g1_1 [Lachancea meyersii CBS 8951]|uniref:LAME_0F14092g1_1 n=1 Tax=Lachancea meyersii CBS 8951 TaxID=1266667 RepID=A0A1G4JXR7_9SACH|nr:LAME_0F14092g1_1 [Lachancea meyersii CBS 8951]
MPASVKHEKEEVITTSRDGQIRQYDSEEVEESLRLIEDVKFFLATAPANWQENQIIRRYYLNNDQGFVSCVFWNNLYYITGTDIVKCCVYRMQKFGREVLDRKKFEEGIFSDLRHLKCGVDATLETPKSEFLSFLFKNMCLKTQKKQKVFFWFSVPHDKLFADALERDMKRQSANQSSTTRSVSEPALSFTYDDRLGISLYDQLIQHTQLQRTKRPDSSTGVESTTSTHSTTNYNQVETKTIISSEYSPTNVKDETIGSDMTLAADDMTSKYTSQELVLNPPQGSPEELELNPISQPVRFTKENGEDDDFPLDYFPVEVEYPDQPLNSNIYYENDFDAGFVPLSAVPPVSAGFYESPHFASEVPFGPPQVTSAARLVFQVPPPPVSATRSQFITNGEYYRSFVKEQEDRDNEKLSPALNQDKEEQEMVGYPREFDRSSKQYSSYHKPAMDARNFHNGYHSGSIYQNRYGYPSMELQQPGVLDPVMTRSYAMEDYLSDNAALYDAYPGGAYCAPSSKPYTPGYRLTPVAPSTPYLGTAQFSNKQLPVGQAKNHPMNPYYQSSPGFRRWGNVHGYLRGFPSIQATSAPQVPSHAMQHPHSASKMYFNKPNMVHKTSSRTPKQRSRAKKLPSVSRSALMKNRNHNRSDSGHDTTNMCMSPSEPSLRSLDETSTKAGYPANNYKNTFSKKDEDQKVIYK